MTDNNLIKAWQGPEGNTNLYHANDKLGAGNTQCAHTVPHLLLCSELFLPATMMHGLTSVLETDNNPDNNTGLAIGSTCQPALTVSAQGEHQSRRSLMQPAQQWIRDCIPV